MAKNPETMDELMERMLSVFPDAVVEELDGEIVIRTGLQEVEGGKVEVTEPEWVDDHFSDVARFDERQNYHFGSSRL